MTILLLRHVQPPPAAQANRRLAAKPSSGALAKNPRTTPHRRRLTVSEIAPTAPDREADTKLRWLFVSPLRVRRIFLLVCGDARTMRSASTSYGQLSAGQMTGNQTKQNDFQT